MNDGLNLMLDRLVGIISELSLLKGSLDKYDDLTEWDGRFVEKVIRPMLEKTGVALGAALECRELLLPDAQEEASTWDADDY